MPQNIKYLKFGLRADKSLSDIESQPIALTSLLDDLSVQTVDNAPIVKSFDAGSELIVDVSTDQITITGHEYTTGDAVTYSCTTDVDVDSTPAVLSPLISGQTYYVYVNDVDAFSLYDTLDNAVNGGDNTAGRIDFTTGDVSNANLFSGTHKLFKIVSSPTGFTSSDLLDPIKGIEYGALSVADRVKDEDPIGQSKDFIQLAAISEKYLRSTDNTSLLVQPRVTLQDQIDNFKSILGSPPNIGGGDGPVAYMVPIERVNTVIPVDVTGKSSQNSAATLGTNIFSTAIDPTIPLSVGPIDFWNQGKWILDGQIHPSFSDEYGLIQWTGYLGQKFSQRVITNGFYIVEEDKVSTSDLETEEYWETKASVVSESITITTNYANVPNAIEGIIVDVSDAQSKSLAEGMTVTFSGESINAVIAEFIYSSDTGLVTGVRTTGSLEDDDQTSTDVVFSWESGSDTQIKSRKINFSEVPVGEKVRVRYTVFWNKFENRTLGTKLLDIDSLQDRGKIYFVDLYSQYLKQQFGEHSYEYFKDNRVSSLNPLSANSLRVDNVLFGNYDPPKTNAAVYRTSNVINSDPDAPDRPGPVRQFKALDNQGKISVTEGFLQERGATTAAGKAEQIFATTEQFVGSKLVIRGKTKLHEYTIKGESDGGVQYSATGYTGTRKQAFIDPAYITEINASDPGSAPTSDDGSSGEYISTELNAANFNGMLWRHLGLVGLYRLEQTGDFTGKLYAIENGQPPKNVSTGDLIYQQEMGWTTEKVRLNSDLTDSTVTNKITTPLVVASSTLGTDADGDFITINTTQIHGADDSALLDTEANYGIGHGEVFATDVVVGVYASTGFREQSSLFECRGIFGKVTNALSSSGTNELFLASTTGINVGDVVQFDGAIPVSTLVESVDAGVNKIVLDENMTQDIPEGRTIIIIPQGAQGVPTSVYDPGDPINKEYCVIPLDTAPPFTGTDLGLKTTTNYPNLTVVSLKVEGISLRVPSGNIATYTAGTLDATTDILKVTHNGTEYKGFIKDA